MIYTESRSRDSGFQGIHWLSRQDGGIDGGGDASLWRNVCICVLLSPDGEACPAFRSTATPAMIMSRTQPITTLRFSTRASMAPPTIDMHRCGFGRSAELPLGGLRGCLFSFDKLTGGRSHRILDFHCRRRLS